MRSESEQRAEGYLRLLDSRQAEIDRLEAALQEIADVTMIESNQVIGTARLDRIYRIARAALDDEPAGP